MTKKEDVSEFVPTNMAVNFVQHNRCKWLIANNSIYEPAHQYLSYSKTCVKRPLSKRPKIGFEDQLSLNAGQKYCRMLPLEHSALLSTFIKLSFVIKIFVLSIFEWLFYTSFTVYASSRGSDKHAHKHTLICLI